MTGTMFAVALNRKAQVEEHTGQELAQLRAAVRRNREDDCAKTAGECLTQILDIANDNLRSAHVYDASFKDGTRVLFIRGGGAVTHEQVLRMATQEAAA